MKNNRIKLPLDTLPTRADAELVLNDLALIISNKNRALTERDCRLITINEEYASLLAECDLAIKAKTDSLRAWAETNPDQFPKGRKSLTMLAGTLGFRTGTPKLALISRAWNWDKVLAAISSIKDMAAMFIRTKEEVDKEAIIGVYHLIKDTPVAQAELLRIGLKIVQDESFFIEPDLTQLTTRQTTEAK
jgi:phage host-nuclease inhibitor protein Gam